ncbi:hypothetical protein [Croceivirga thetidis]|uniref:Uncharacterized protein n=1 Tax=Croceivirga thetidis TaxID=2721623 RepID=A0ABX1GQD8_9FLAO|nr:hypothetical protein [Croceivirga thetidis]NKI32120.1 hypothetical protein [Croceivirga thetidis]
MKNAYFILLFMVSLVLKAQSEDSSCQLLYSNVTNALSHTKKAVDVTGFDHQVYFAKRALSIFEDSKKHIELCQCSAVEDKSFEISKNLKKAVDPIDWYAGRFYSKKALEEIDGLITLLDYCSTSSYVEPIMASNNDEQKDAGEDIESAHLQYNSYLEDLNSSIEKLLFQLEKDFTTGQEGDVIQRKFYSERTKKLLQSAILQIEESNE